MSGERSHYYGVDWVWSDWDKEWLKTDLSSEEQASDEKKWKWDETHTFRLTLILKRVGGIGECFAFSGF